MTDNDVRCPVCGGSVPANQIGNEFNGHKYADPSLDEQAFFRAIEQDTILLPTRPGVYVSNKRGWMQFAPFSLTEYGQWFQFGNPVYPPDVSIPWTGLVRLVREDGGE